MKRAKEFLTVLLSVCVSVLSQYCYPAPAQEYIVSEQQLQELETMYQNSSQTRQKALQELQESKIQVEELRTESQNLRTQSQELTESLKKERAKTQDITKSLSSLEVTLTQKETEHQNEVKSLNDTIAGLKAKANGLRIALIVMVFLFIFATAFIAVYFFMKAKGAVK